MNQSKEMVENLLRLAEKIPVPFSFWLKTLPLMSKSEVTFRVGKVMEPSAPSLLGSNLRGERFQLKDLKLHQHSKHGDILNSLAPRSPSSTHRNLFVNQENYNLD